MEPKRRRLASSFCIIPQWGRPLSLTGCSNQKLESWAQHRVDVSRKCTGKNGMSADSITEILEAQNKIRAQLKLAKLTWNCDLAAIAQEWATRGIFEHRPDNIFGENVYVSANADVTPAFAVQRWLSEGDFWNNGNGTCQNGKVCSHFTQIVWRFTKQVGCGINRNALGKWKVMVVCDYDPTGSDDGPAY